MWRTVVSAFVSNFVRLHIGERSY